MDGTRGALVEAIVGMREKEAVEAARALLDAGGDPLELLDACREAVEVVGQRFERGEYFLPELMLAGEILTQISGMVKARVADGAPSRERRLGRVVIGTVKGDIHDIGKNIVSFLLDANGFEVIDLGVDVPPKRFVEAVREFEPQVVGMSCLLTLAYDPMKETVRALQDAGLKDRVKVMIGGAATNDQIRVYTGADAWGKDAAEAVSIARAWVGR
ncbi:MAG: cobalamin-dependent protein [Bacillota bacterium]|nr:cobalamin-dependent protein [Bacillota bacterium]